MKNWTQVLAERNSGQRPGFAVPADLDKRTKTEVTEEAERRGIDPADLTADQLRAAVRGA